MNQQPQEQQQPRIAYEVKVFMKSGAVVHVPAMDVEVRRGRIFRNRITRVLIAPMNGEEQPMHIDGRQVDAVTIKAHRLYTPEEVEAMKAEQRAMEEAAAAAAPDEKTPINA